MSGNFVGLVNVCKVFATISFRYKILFLLYKVGSSIFSVLMPHHRTKTLSADTCESIVQKETCANVVYMSVFLSSSVQERYFLRSLILFPFTHLYTYIQMKITCFYVCFSFSRFIVSLCVSVLELKFHCVDQWPSAKKWSFPPRTERSSIRRTDCSVFPEKSIMDDAAADDYFFYLVLFLSIMFPNLVT